MGGRREEGGGGVEGLCLQEEMRLDVPIFSLFGAYLFDERSERATRDEVDLEIANPTSRETSLALIDIRDSLFSSLDLNHPPP